MWCAGAALLATLETATENAMPPDLTLLVAINGAEVLGGMRGADSFFGARTL